MQLATTSAHADEASPAQLSFEAATALIGVDDRRAATLLERLVEESPQDEYAPDALLEAAALAEEHLGAPAHAAALYQRLLERYPTHRHALRAAARRDFLAANLTAGEAPLVEYQAILTEAAKRPPAESRARLERLLATYPTFPLARQARLWIEQSARPIKTLDPTSPTERRLLLLSATYLFVFIIISWFLARGALLPIPLELKIYLPVALLLSGASFLERRPIAIATAAIAFGGGVIIWLSGAATKRRLITGSLSIPHRLLRALAIATAIGALCYATLHATHLTRLVVDTLRNGPQPR